MQKFVDNGELQQACSVFELMRKHEFRNHLAAWNMFFRICARLGQYDDAIRGYEDMKSSKIKANERCCTALIESYGMLKRLPELLQEFEDLDLQKDLVFYTQCIKECARIGDVVIAEKIYEELNRKRIQVLSSFSCQGQNCFLTFTFLKLFCSQLHQMKTSFFSRF